MSVLLTLKLMGREPARNALSVVDTSCAHTQNAMHQNASIQSNVCTALSTTFIVCLTKLLQMYYSLFFSLAYEETFLQVLW